MNSKTDLLLVQDLSISFGEKKKKEVVHNITFSINKGEILGVVGESGSGKSVTAHSVLRLLAEGGKISNGSIWFDGVDLTKLPEEEMVKIRGDEISMVFQEPMTSLNPVLTVGVQIEEMLLLHTKKSSEERKASVYEMMDEVGLQNPESLYSKYPHQLSGGMRQRIMIAMAMICKPRLLIADEPTTALDVTIQAKILELLKELNRKHGTTILFISHDLTVVRNLCDRLLVMYDGRIVESGISGELFQNPKEEYTKKLLAAAEIVHDSSLAMDSKDSSVTNRILEVKDLKVYYTENAKKLFQKKQRKEVVKGISLEVMQGESVGIVGESGCGKSTLAKAITNLVNDMEGRIILREEKPQMVFQDPYGSLNPCKRIGWLLEEPLKLQKVLSKQEREQRVEEILQKVNLPIEYKNRYPRDLSGGQRQRVAIARAMILHPKFVVLDEPVSALDVTVQAQVLTLLKNLKQEFQLSYLFISHDMGVIHSMCDRVCVMYQGEIVESGKTEEVFQNPTHEYTKKLLSSVPK
ncbi:ABC transporter ATP-binding protein [Lachnoclostridium phytofermentans]|uniref:ABC transporter related n=1 Tax=Lachnoclostridium phytofermentans (strain ATCC 700394 / DSM 18823 / ISDg) TaxID=357809 RepID=A9KHF4_LACP7|nr:ABC transporter ATP-binding protein [Lachnoclostridium phytofermentans]ABX40821.1 ABC transporter related [Lachnoclostridium phytofermentans ISDg]